MVKASVGKENRQRLGIGREQMDRYTPILGNLKTFEFDERQVAAEESARDVPYQGPDMPEEFDGAW